jgi:hypothetical protein
MSDDPTPVRGTLEVYTPELRARRALQRKLGHLGRDADEAQRYAQACQGECAAPGSVRGGVLRGDGHLSRGMVAVDARGNPLESLPDGPVSTRPCFDCNRDRWEAWQAGELTGPPPGKVENLADRRAAAARADTQHRTSFA